VFIDRLSGLRKGEFGDHTADGDITNRIGDAFVGYCFGAWQPCNSPVEINFHL
jgi:hypothetical protein